MKMKTKIWQISDNASSCGFASPADKAIQCLWFQEVADFLAA